MISTATIADTGLLRNWMRIALKAAAQQKQVDMPPDVAACLDYLWYLDALVSASRLAPSQLLADEAEALRIKDEVAGELSGSMTRCPHCQRLTERGLSCRVCGRVLTTPSAVEGRAGRGR